MISEKEMLIVHAVNALGVDIKRNNELCSPGDAPAILRGVGCFVVGTTGYEKGFYSLVCTVDKYNQCILEMSEGAFVPNSKPEFVYGQDVYVDDERFAKLNLKFGCLSLDGNNAVLLNEGHYISWPLSGISSKPFKTKEEIEREQAELDQLNRILEKHSGKFLHPNQFKRAISEMQKDGELAEILLPLEKK